MLTIFNSYEHFHIKTTINVKKSKKGAQKAPFSNVKF